MTDTADLLCEPRGAAQSSPLRGARRGALSERLFGAAARAAGLVVLAVLAYIVYSTFTYAWPAMRREGWGYLTGSTWSSSRNIYGSLALVYGTVVTSLIAVCVAVPLSIGVALFITELMPRRGRAVAVGLIDLLAAVPSVVFGLVGLLYLHAPLQSLYVRFAGPNASGSSLFTAGLVVAFMILPIITSVTREVFSTVPRVDRDAAYALGATRWEMFRAAVFPYSYSGVVGAVMLGLGRALGETVAVALVVGSAVQMSPNLFEPGYSMAAIIANTFNGEGNLLNQQALMGLGVVLFGITVAVNAAARAVVSRAERRMRGAP